MASRVGIVVAFCVAVVVLSLAMQRSAAAPQDKPAPEKKKAKEKTKPLIVNAQLTNKDPFDKVMRRSHCKIYSYKMAAGRAYRISLVSNRFDCYLRLEDSKGRQLAANDDGGAGLNSKIVFTPTKAGTYKVIATSLRGGATGAFTLTVAPPGKRKQILNVKAKLTTDDPYDVVRQGSRHKLYKVKMVAGRTYIIDHMSRNFDCYLRLEDFRGNQITADDDGGVGLNSRIQFIPRFTDTYRIIATSLASNQQGPFQVTVTEQ